nr:MAG TPA: hypothetical protein [Caudoviricetes sp.]DAN43133.1 MAG TPA: hypothetical protein [Caudoviricetes sp.]DAW54929.1 MAG TPA: hypothetical protein [Caudoviricetes sp.]
MPRIRWLSIEKCLPYRYLFRRFLKPVLSDGF